MNKIHPLRAFAAALLIAPTAGLAGGAHSGGHGHGEAAHGRPGKASAAARTVEVVMHDNWFEPESIEVAPGETIRFKVRNAGEFVHEFNIGTPAMHAAHQDEMQMMMDHGVLKGDSIDMKAAKAMQASMGHGMHDDPNSVLLAPGETGEVVWTFPEHMDGTIEFACNVPGHYGSGMVGEVELKHGR
ncbi:cupredoxin domain-containing protein [Oceanicella actignis]|uniref:Uncharacterized copper-binding protein, cupredoxin-like subfamily n=1 Tax=Oceanicella actignis TaxID=1189325 RepID=A0A1M7U111_9RHOB|nr:plastocyanin/azurin family copper-binding protein [Oceanicella actignis]SET85421.1 Uncharacterized copper-binding protein, cupredoxin-like subfamily [Oceanicella actignis]SHN76711.1 Uncharacterized copper-binding protein, cupredoxin-like subfamily [Oceanicella actignis]